MRRALLFTVLTSCCGGVPVAAATSESPACQPAAEQVLAAINAWRAAPQSCGGMRMTAAPPLRWSLELAASARRFAEELALRGTISHEGLQARTLADRMRLAGYPAWRAGENLAAGQRDLDEVLAQWMASPGHCENLMQPAFEDAGLACVAGSGRFGRYWVLHLGLRSSPGR